MERFCCLSFSRKGAIKTEGKSASQETSLKDSSPPAFARGDPPALPVAPIGPSSIQQISFGSGSVGRSAFKNLLLLLFLVCCARKGNVTKSCN